MTYFSKAFGANAQHGVDAAQTALTQTEAAKAQAETKAQEGANEQCELDEEWLAQLNLEDRFGLRSECSSAP